jgi:hypothetical protein
MTRAQNKCNDWIIEFMGAGLNVKCVLNFKFCCALSGVANDCSSPNCKECRTRHSLYSQLPYVVECGEANVLFVFPANCVTQT